MTTTYYLAEIRCDGDDTPEVCVLTADDLSQSLTGYIEYEHYSGCGYEVRRLFRYDAGALTPLTVHRPARTATATTGCTGTTRCAPPSARTATARTWWRPPSPSASTGGPEPWPGHTRCAAGRYG
jgi:hypothetical protein